MEIELASLAPEQVYHLVTQTVIPRPIAWILTENSQAIEREYSRFNLAPFSFFNFVSKSPPTLLVSIGKKPDGSLKDTRRNLVIGAFCVVHMVNVQQIDKVSRSSHVLAYGESELDSLGMQLIEFSNFKLPRLAECSVAFGCQVFQVIDLGPIPQGLVLLEIKHVHVNDDVVTTDHKNRVKVDAEKVNPLSRLGANEYASLGSIIKFDRPE